MANCEKCFCEHKESRFSKEEIEETLKDYWSHVDYKVGDWVETCNMLPGIVQNINISYDKKGDYFHDEVEIFYPHYALCEKYGQEYSGGSYCSVIHCGVHKIEPEYACKLMALGEERLKKLWEKCCKETPEGQAMNWAEMVEDEYERVFGDRIKK